MPTILLLTISNIFMTFAWYGHLKFRSEGLWKVMLVSWGIAFFEILFPGSREPHRLLSIPCRPTEDDPGNHYSLDLSGFLRGVPRRQIQVELRRRFCFYRDCRILCLSQMVV